MVDEGRAPTSPEACAAVRESLELLALDALDAAEEAAVRAHLTTCAGCRAELERLTDVVAELLAEAPALVAPADLADRVVAATLAGGPQAGAAGSEPAAGVRARGGVRRWVVGAVAAAALVAGGLVGAVVGRATSGGGEAAGPRAEVTYEVRTGTLVASSGVETGSVVLTAGERPTLVMRLDHVAAGVAYGCAVRTTDGEVVEVGSWTPADTTDTTWAVPVDDAVVHATEVLLTGPGGLTLASAALT